MAADETNQPEEGGLASIQDPDAFMDSAEIDRRRAKRRARQSAMGDATELDLIPIMGLFTAMVLYLVQSYASDPVNIHPGQDTQLPKSSSKLHLEEAVQVAISSRMILVNNKIVARVRNGRVAAKYKRDRNPAQMFIEPLYNKLKAEAQKQKTIAKYNKKQQFRGLLTVIGDKRVPFRLLTEVLYTAGQAEYGQYKFAIIKQES